MFAYVVIMEEHNSYGLENRCDQNDKLKLVGNW